MAAAGVPGQGGDRVGGQEGVDGEEAGAGDYQGSVGSCPQWVCQSSLLICNLWPATGSK